jgi:flagellar FliL protein
MLKNKKVMLALAIPLVLFAGYTMTKPKPTLKEKIKGSIYVMPKDFLINLSDGRYARVTVALELAPGQSDGASATAGSSSESTAGTLPEEPLVREIVSNTITDANGEQLISSSGRNAIKAQILRAVSKQTDVKVQAVLFPDLTVQ